jgi:23S rRNA (adenine2503-C2)-methyltransferase
MTESQRDCLSNLAAVTHWAQARDIPPYRVGQIQRWMCQGMARAFEDMTDLPKTLRRELEEAFTFWSTSVQRHEASADGTEKLVVGLADGGSVECVLLRDGPRRTICVSSQIGCAMGCVFCASGLDGVDRNLAGFEIVEQMLHLQRLLPSGERISHIVMMGMGEPLANLPSVLSALSLASCPDGLAISPRRITISTVGIPAGILKLAEVEHPYQLAISLHAPNDALRNQIVPVNDKIGIASILEAADQYFRMTGRRLTYEYVLLAGINDQPQHARELVGLLGKRGAMLNVIPYNPVAGLPYQTPGPAAIRSFRQILVKGGINVNVRERKGDQINAACGQLRRVVTGAARARPDVD